MARAQCVCARLCALSLSLMPPLHTGHGFSLSPPPHLSPLGGCRDLQFACPVTFSLNTKEIVPQAFFSILIFRMTRFRRLPWVCGGCSVLRSVFSVMRARRGSQHSHSKLGVLGTASLWLCIASALRGPTPLPSDLCTPRCRYTLKHTHTEVTNLKKKNCHAISVCGHSCHLLSHGIMT